MDVKILSDNDAKSGFRRGWGFSCLVGDDVVFDTGGDVNTLLFNMYRLSIDFRRIKVIVLSHEHGDHTGGLPVLRELGKVTVFVPRSLSSHLKRRLASQPNVTLIEVGKARAIATNIFTTGELGSFVKEQSLIVKTCNGLTVIAGCSHPGLEHILETSSTFGELYGVMGGFHGFSQLAVLRRMKLIAPCHCTWLKQELFERYPASSVRCSAGCIIGL